MTKVKLCQNLKIVSSIWPDKYADLWNLILLFLFKKILIIDFNENLNPIYVWLLN